MKYADFMQDTKLWLLFAGLNEPEDNSLRLYFYRTKLVPAEPLVLGDTVLGGESVVADTALPVLQVDFESYVGYSVRNESFFYRNNAEEFEGEIFRVYSKSTYLDYIKASTFADEKYPGPFKHYGIGALNHVIDVISTSEPVVTEHKIK